MKEIISTLKSISKSGSNQEMIRRTPESYIEFLAFLPMFLLLVIPLYQMICIMLSPPPSVFASFSFKMNISAAMTFAFIFGTLFLFLKHLKKVDSGISTNIKQSLSWNIPMIFFGFMMIMMVMSAFVNGFTEKVFLGENYRKESLFTYLAYFAVLFFISSKIEIKKYKSVMLYGFILASIPLAVCVYIDFDIVRIKAFMDKLYFNGVFSNSNHYAYYLTMVVLVSAVLYIKEKNTVLKMLAILSFVINTVILIMNNTFGCYLAVFGGLIFNCIVISITENKFNKHTLLLPFVFLLLTFIMSFRFYTFMSNFTVFLSDLSSIIFEEEDAVDAGSGRWILWMITVRYIAENPLFGVGVDGISEILQQEGGNFQTHNEFLQYTSFFGIPAGIAYVSGAFSVFLNGLKNKFRLDMYSTAALVAAFGYLFSSAFGNTMYYTAPFFFILLGMGFSVNRAEN